MKLLIKKIGEQCELLNAKKLFLSSWIKENYFTSIAFLLNPLEVYESVTEPNLAFYGLIAHRAMSHGFA